MSNVTKSSGPHPYDPGPCPSREIAWVAAPELSLNSLHPLSSGLPPRDGENQNGPGVLLGKERLGMPRMVRLGALHAVHMHVG